MKVAPDFMRVDSALAPGGEVKSGPAVAATRNYGLSPGDVLIYVVDDQPVVAELVATFLRLKGYQIRVFFDPQLALQTFAQSGVRPQILVTDFVMEGLDGLQLIDRCRRLQPALKCVLISGNIDDEALERSRIKPDQFLRKPFISSQLVALVQSLVQA